MDENLKCLCSLFGFFQKYELYNTDLFDSFSSADKPALSQQLTQLCSQLKEILWLRLKNPAFSLPKIDNSRLLVLHWAE